ncbi:MAG: tyrosine-type recombinase/integrase, partial [Bacillota bacterium]|nr:tyrosine-type recombinase/integrase [Bacillota bacterium]
IYLKKFKNKVDGNKKIILKSEFIKTINLIEVNFPNSKRDIMIIYLLFNTQLKLNEILSLKKLDFKDNFQFVKVNNKIISLDKDVVKYLTNYKIDNESYLFTNNNGNVLSRQSVWKFIKKYNCKLSLNLSIDILNRSYKINKMLESFNKEEL